MFPRALVIAVIVALAFAAPTPEPCISREEFDKRDFSERNAPCSAFRREPSIASTFGTPPFIGFKREEEAVPKFIGFKRSEASRSLVSGFKRQFPVLPDPSHVEHTQGEEKREEESPALVSGFKRQLVPIPDPTHVQHTQGEEKRT